MQQRAAAFSQFAARDSAWLRWQTRTGARLAIEGTVLDRLAPAELRLNSRLWALDVGLSAADYASLSPGPKVTLRFVHTLEQALVAIATRVEYPPPTRLGRTKAEAEWMNQGGIDPGPGTATPLRVRKPPGPMPENRFWTVIEATAVDDGSAFRLGWQQADRFTSQLRLLIAALDSPRHRDAAVTVLGSVSDDVWEDVRAWVVSRGRDAYERALVERMEISTLLDALDSQDALSLGEQLLHLEGRE